MFSVRIHGRGGQGVVTTTQLLSVAVHLSGRYAQAFSNFGSEPTGAPIVSFCQIDDRPIRLREPVSAPDALIVQDPTLLHQADVLAGLAGNGYVVLNARRPVAELDLPASITDLGPDRLIVVPATQLALRYLGRPLPNVALLGAFAALTHAVPIGAVVKAIELRFAGPSGRRNIAAALAAHDLVRLGVPARTRLSA
jgi:pyruvate ferredoxin oxidoreductase gamma subunit